MLKRALTILDNVQSYESGRKAICLKDTGAKDNATSYCPSEVLNNIESSGTPITYEYGQVALKNPMKAVNTVPTWAYCVPCTQGMLAPVINALNLLNPEWATSVTGVVDGKCGTGFVLTSAPASLEDGITYEAPNANNSNNAGGPGSGKESNTGGEFGDESAALKHQSFTAAFSILLSMALLAVLGL